MRGYLFNMKLIRVLTASLLPGLVLTISTAMAQTTEPALTNATQDHYDADCVEQALQSWRGDASLQSLREHCAESINSAPTAEKSALEKRIQAESRHAFEPFVVVPYRPSYMLIGSQHFTPMNDAVYADAGLLKSDKLDATEVKFQISLKVPLAEDVLGGRLFVAYTNRSFWQAYNDSNSAPFRETNHEPEIWLTFDNAFSLLGRRNRLLDIGLSHQSNGQIEPLSRSWNRLYLRFTIESGNSAISFKPWWRIPESASEDDNSDILDYMGAGEILLATKIGHNNLSMLLRNNLDVKENRGALELNYSYRIHRNLNGYVQWFYGYGESLIDYNYLNHSLGIGVQLNSWL